MEQKITLRTSMYFYIILFSLALVPTFAADIQGPATFHEAMEKCKNLGGYLPGEINSSEYNKTVQIMREKNVDEIWHTLRSRDLNGWQWSNGSKYKGLINRDDSHLQCAGAWDQVYGRKCFIDADGYICQVRDCSLCQKGKCIELSSDGFACARALKVNWFDARDDCRLQGGSLLVEHVGDVKKNAQALGINKEFWIGLTRVTWEYSQRGQVRRYRWREREGYDQKETSKNCSVIKLTGWDSKWLLSSCKDRKKFICLKDKMTTTAEMTSTLTAEKTTGVPSTEAPSTAKPRVTAGGEPDAGPIAYERPVAMTTLNKALVAGCAFLLVVAIVFGIAWRKKRKQTRRFLPFPGDLESRGHGAQVCGHTCEQRQLHSDHTYSAKPHNMHLSFSDRPHPDVPGFYNATENATYDVIQNRNPEYMAMSLPPSVPLETHPNSKSDAACPTGIITKPEAESDTYLVAVSHTEELRSENGSMDLR